MTRVRIVAPLAGAWIETQARNCLSDTVKNVAPLAGAWIETACENQLLFCSMSHPSRVRGLKH